MLMAATDGRGTLKMQKCLFKRLGISFFPPPGVFIAARYCTSTIIFMSPMGFSREYMPPSSRSWRTTSLVTWSPQSFITGMEMSSTKTIIFFPDGGPKVRPDRFSTDDSMATWNVPGCVRDENVMSFVAVVSLSNPAMNCLIAVVFAVPGPPTNSACLSTLVTILRSDSRRTESRVGMMSLANLGFSSATGYSHAGTWVFQCLHSVSSSETKYSKKVSSGSSKFGASDSASRTIALFSGGLSFMSRRPPNAHVQQ